MTDFIWLNYLSEEDKKLYYLVEDSPDEKDQIIKRLLEQKANTRSDWPYIFLKESDYSLYWSLRGSLEEKDLIIKRLLEDKARANSSIAVPTGSINS
jgi:hypothetical protein